MPRTSLRVLVVEDDPADRHRLVELLRDEGVSDIVGVDCGRCAVDHVDLSALDLIISDLHMPNMDGIELLRDLADRRVDVPIALMSSHDEAMLQSAQVLAEGYGLVVRGFMPKPVNPARLREIIRQHAQRTVEEDRAPRAEVDLGRSVLEAALADGSLRAHFQPQVELATGKILAAEALLRWEGEDAPAVPTDQLIAAIHAHGLMDQLTDSVLNDALRVLRAQGRDGSTVSVNISPVSLQDVSVADRWYDLVSSHGVEPARVTFELTEETVLTDQARAFDVLTRLRLRGFGLALDDFGSGYSVLSLLADLPLTELKVDRTLVHGMAADWRRRAMLESVVQLADRFGLRTVAEGVELVEDYAALGAIGCTAAQGWLISRAVPADQLAEVGWGRVATSSESIGTPAA